MIFSTVMFPTERSATDALLLVESIRTFAGSMSQEPIWCFTPEIGKEIPSTVKDRLLALNVTLIPFEIDREILHFPFTGEVLAAARSEARAIGKTDLIAWLATNTIVLKEPKDFILQDDKNLGFRPVHHTLLGSRFDEPLDPFWTLIYKCCDVPDDRIFAMTTHVDNTRIRPYFNAGILITRPENALLQTWCDTFFKVYQEDEFDKFYDDDEFYDYETFIHQALLSGVILSTMKTDEIQELPPEYNYPLHLHEEDTSSHRPSSLEELVTVRHEGFYSDPEWQERMPAEKPLKKWIAKTINR